MTASPSPLGLELAGLYDCRRLSDELGISRAAAERIMTHVPKVQIEGLRKVYVVGSDVQTYIESRKFQ
jgi:hypothetical protein